MKWLNKIWPWSLIAAHRADADKWHAMAKAQNDHSVFMEQMEHCNSFYTFLHRSLGEEKMMGLVNEYNAQLVPLYGFLGALGRPDKSKAVFPTKGSGEFDPKLGADDSFSLGIAGPIARSVAGKPPIPGPSGWTPESAFESMFESWKKEDGSK
jgi:hypothetical protein